MSRSSKPRSRVGRARFFGPAPILPGENPKAYKSLLDRVVTAIGPRDCIEEIWVRDLTDVVWSLFRWRRIRDACLANIVREEADEEASELAEAEGKRLQGPEKEEMTKLLASALTWERAVALYPRAHQKFQELRATLDMDDIQARVIPDNMTFIHSIESLIAPAQGRIDQIMRELHRYRFMQSQAQSSPSPEAQVEQPQEIAGSLVKIVPSDE
jgi:hypothetical protein